MINQVLCGDCFEIMKSIPDGSVDMILCDPPYQVTARNQWDKILPFDKLWQSCHRVAKTNAAIVMTAAQPFASQLIVSNIDNFRFDWIWRKNKKTNFLNAKKMPLRNHEHVLVFYRKQPTYNPQKTTGHAPTHSFVKHTSDGNNYGKTKIGVSGGGSTERYPTSVIDFPVINNDSGEKFHPTQKPVELFSYLVKTYSNENDVVLDFCSGSGTTGVSAIRTNRKFICIDSNEEYCGLARNRIKVENLKSTS